MPNLQNKIVASEVAIVDEVKKIEEFWNAKKPYSGDLMPKEAIDILNMVSGQVSRIKDAYINCSKVK